jgi:chromosome segregation ATPase
MLSSGTKDQFYNKQNERKRIEREISALENNLLMTQGEVKRLKLDQGRVHGYMLQSLSKLKQKANASLVVEISNIQAQIRHQESNAKQFESEVKRNQAEIAKLNEEIRKHEKNILNAQQEINRSNVEIDKLNKKISEDKDAQTIQKKLIEQQNRLAQNKNDSISFERKASNIENQISRLRNELQRYR